MDDPRTTVGNAIPVSNARLAAGRAAQAQRRSRVVGRVPLPRVWPLRASDVYALVGGNALLIAGMWLRHGNLE